MKYFIDTEFHEYAKKPYFGRWGKPIDTIELISIGIVAEDGREYYAICNEFDVDAAWGNEWLKKNVLLSVFEELVSNLDPDTAKYFDEYTWVPLGTFDKSNLKYLLKRFGKSRSQIADTIKKFVGFPNYYPQTHYMMDMNHTTRPEFYAYYADYDWVVFCWLFGRMIDLPKGFPKYCIDLKQMVDEQVREMINDGRIDVYAGGTSMITRPAPFKACVERFKNTTEGYPLQQENEHNALADAMWNKQLYDFLKEFQLNSK